MTKNFQDIVDQVRQRGRRRDQPPAPMAEIAARCGVSTVHLYNLIAGRRNTLDWRIEFFARVLRVPAQKIRDALAQTREETRSDE